MTEPIRYTVAHCWPHEWDNPYAYIFESAFDSFRDAKDAAQGDKAAHPCWHVLILEHSRVRPTGPWDAWRDGNVIMEVGAE